MFDVSEFESLWERYSGLHSIGIEIGVLPNSHKYLFHINKCENSFCSGCVLDYKRTYYAGRLKTGCLYSFEMYKNNVSNFYIIMKQFPLNIAT